MHITIINLGHRTSRLHRSPDRYYSPDNDDVHWETDQFDGEVRESSGVSLRELTLDPHGLALK